MKSNDRLNQIPQEKEQSKKSDPGKIWGYVYITLCFVFGIVVYFILFVK